MGHAYIFLAVFYTPLACHSLTGGTNKIGVLMPRDTMGHFRTFPQNREVAHLLIVGIPIGRLVAGLPPLVARYFGKVRLCHAGETIPILRPRVRPENELGGSGGGVLRGPAPFWVPSDIPKDRMRCNVPIDVDTVPSLCGNCFGG